MKTYRKGFTLIELLLVIGIIAILAAIVIVAINPTRQLGQARNAQRNSDVNTLLNAIWQYAIDNSGNMPCEDSNTNNIDCEQEDTATPVALSDIRLDSTWRMISKRDHLTECDIGAVTAPSGAEHHCEAADITMNSNCIDLSRALEGDYLVSIPTDPRYSNDSGEVIDSTDNSRSFYVAKSSTDGRVTVRGCFSEAGSSAFQVTR